MPRGGGEDGICTRVGQRYCLAPAHHGVDPGELLCEHRAHALIRLDGDHVVGPVDQKPGQSPGACTEINHPGDWRRKKPVDSRRRRSGSVPLIVGGNLPKLAARAAFSSGSRWDSGTPGTESGPVTIRHYRACADVDGPVAGTNGRARTSAQVTCSSWGHEQCATSELDQCHLCTRAAEVLVQPASGPRSTATVTT